MSNVSRPREVRINPDGDIVWHASEISVRGHEGTLFASPDTTLTTADYLDILTEIDKVEELQHERRAAGEDEIAADLLPHKEIGRGAHGTVYAIGSLAAKTFVPTRHHGHLAELRATVGLAEGLRRLDRPAEETDFKIRGVQVESAYIPTRRTPYNPNAPHSPYTMWLMEQIHPVCNTQNQLSVPLELARFRFPDTAVRHALYVAAHTLLGMPASNYDDKLSNLLVEAIPGDSAKGSLVKIDIQAHPGTLDNY